MADEIQIPQAQEPLTIEGGLANASWYRVLARLATAFNSTARSLNDTGSGLDSKADKDQIIAWPWGFKFPENETVILLQNSPIAFSIAESTTKTEVGTATVTIKINGSTIGGSANSASTSEDIQAHTTSNAVAVGDDVTVVFSAASADCENLNLSMKLTRTLA